MNLLLLDTPLDRLTLPAADARARHVREVLRVPVGGTIDVGAWNGPRGKAEVLTAAGDLELRLRWFPEPPAPLPAVDVLVGLPRPQTARDLLRDGAALGVRALRFFAADKGEPAYAASSLWQTSEWRERLRQGAEQAFATTAPEVSHHPTLAAALEAAPPAAARWALDVYEGTARFGADAARPRPLTLALGPERGWSARERALLRAAGWGLASLGPRVLRVETAFAAAVAVALAAAPEVP